MAIPVLRTLADITPGDHLCLLYATEDEHRAMLTPFIRDGLAHNERVLYIANAHDGATILQYLRDEGVPIETYRACNQFVLLTAQDAYLREGVFDPDKMIGMLEAETQAALSAGFTALRVTGEMTWALQSSPGAERLIEYETKLNHFFPTHRALAVCQYDQRRFSAEVLLDVLRTHPFAIVGTTLHTNPFYVPPDEFLQPDQAQVTLNHWLANLAAQHELELALREANTTLEQRVAARTQELANEIAQHQRTAQEARTNEAIARTLVNTIFESVLLLEADGTVLEINEVGAQRLGKTRAEIIGKNVYDFLLAQVAATRRQKVELALQTNQPIVFEDERWGRVIKQSVVVVPDDTTPRTRLAIFAQDITEQKRHEANMRQTADLLEAARHAQSLYLTTGNLGEAARHLLQALGRITASEYGFLDQVLHDESGKLEQRNLATFNLVSNQDSPQLNHQMHAGNNLEFRHLNNLASAPLLTGKLVIANDCASYSPSDQVHPPIHSFMGIPLYFGEELIGIVGVANRAEGYSETIAKFLEPFTTTCASILYAARQDRREKETASALEQSKAHLTAIIENTDALVWSMDTHYRLLWCNNRFARTFTTMWHTELHIGDSMIPGSLSPTMRTQMQEYYDRAMRGESLVFEILAPTHRWYEVSLSPIRSVQGHVTGAVGLARDVTNRKRAEQALQQSEERYRILFEAITDAVLLYPINPDGTLGKFIQANNVACVQLGYLPHELIQLTPQDLAAPESSHHLYEIVHALREGRSVTFEQVYRAKDGQTIPFEIHASPFRLGNQIAVIAIARDISERKRAETELRIMLTKYKTLFEAFPLGISISDHAGNILEANPESARLLGVPVPEHTQRQIDSAVWQIIRPDGSPMPPAEFASVRALAEQRRIENIEMGIVKPDRSVTWLNVTAAPIPLPGYGVAITYNDITERKHAQDAMRESEERYRTLVETANEGIWTIDANAVTTLVNTKMAEMLGYTVEEMQGKVLFEFMDEEGVQLAQRYFERRRQGIAEQHDFKFRRKDGQPIWCLVSTNPLMRHGQFVGALAAVTDITERKRTEDALSTAMHRWQTTFDAIPDAICLLDKNMRIEQCNAAMAKLLGKAATEIIGRVCCEVVHETSTPIHNCPFERMHASHQRESLDVLLGNAWYTITADPLLDEHGHWLGAVHTMRDVTNQRKFEDELRRVNAEQERWVRALAEQNFQITTLSEMGDLLQTCQSPTEAFQAVPRFAHKLFPGQTGALYMRLPNQDLVEAVALWGDLTSAEQVFGITDCWALRRNRPHVFEQDGLTCTHIRQPTHTHLCIPLFSQNEVIGMLHLRTPQTSTAEFQPISLSLAENFAEHLGLAISNLRLQEILREQAVRDPLTGLHNRRYMEETLERELRRAARHQRPVSLIAIDLDYLKDINDRFGHDVGDEALRQFANLLKRNVRGADVACRYGGDEFLLILTDTALDDARQRAQELNTATHNLTIRHAGAEPIHLTMSAGVAECPTHGTYPQSVLRAADAALYRAKTAGRDCVIVAET